jgi:hypothetical protein
MLRTGRTCSCPAPDHMMSRTNRHTCTVPSESPVKECRSLPACHPAYRRQVLELVSASVRGHHSIRVCTPWSRSPSSLSPRGTSHRIASRERTALCFLVIQSSHGSPVGPTGANTAARNHIAAYRILIAVRMVTPPTPGESPRAVRVVLRFVERHPNSSRSTGTPLHPHRLRTHRRPCGSNPTLPRPS